MKREIKFRAWDRLNKEMIEVYAIDNTKKGATEENAYESKGYNEHGQKRFYLHNVDLMQFTGLLDKNGKEIYEGDIVHNIKRLKNWEVKFHRQHVGFVMIRQENMKNYFSQFNVNFSDGEIYQCDYIEVIGNIFEHPELLTQSNP